MTRILFATDLHGHWPAYTGLLAQARRRQVDAVLLGGDLLPHAGAEDGVETQTAFLRERLAPLLAGFHAQAPEVFVGAILGNDDLAGCVPVVEELERQGLWTLLHGCRVPLAGEWFVAGCPYVPVTPFAWSDFDRRDEEGWEPAHAPGRVLVSDPGGSRWVGLEDVLQRPSLDEELGRLAALGDPARTIYVVHTPPWNTKLDCMANGAPIGSRALRRFVQDHQPPLTLHGHIHESPSRTGAIHDRLGGTLCVNPGGSLFGLRAALVDLDDLERGPVVVGAPA